MEDSITLEGVKYFRDIFGDWIHFISSNYWVVFDKEIIIKLNLIEQKRKREDKLKRILCLKN